MKVEIKVPFIEDGNVNVILVSPRGQIVAGYRIKPGENDEFEVFAGGKIEIIEESVEVDNVP